MKRAITFKNRLWMGIAFFHLTLVTLGAAGIDFNLNGPLGRVYNIYARTTGSAFGYSFFAPGVFDQLMARFEVVDQNGKHHEVPLTTGVSNEADIRFTSVVDQFTMPLADDAPGPQKLALKRSLSASLARIFFRRYPKTKEVIVHLEEYQYVSLPDFQKGAQPKMKPVYRAKFILNPTQAKL